MKDYTFTKEDAKINVITPVCLCVCVFVSLSASRICQNVFDGFEPNIVK